MDESTRHWFDKLEVKADKNTNLLNQICTKVDFVSERITEQNRILEKHDKRLDELESWRESQNAINERQNKLDNLRWLKITGIATAVVAAKAVAIWIGSEFF